MSVLTKMTPVQKSELKAALESIKTGDYKGTAIKVELEAQLNRPEGSRNNRCDACDGDGYIFCTECDQGDVPCPNTGCEPDEAVEDCEFNCQNGWIDCEDCGGEDRVDCSECDGTGRTDDERASWTVNYCRDWLLENVPKASADTLIYSKFYNDGSVDSEFTFTLPIEKARLAVHFIEAFAKMAKLIEKQTGLKADTEGAGMHIAVLNSEDGDYPHNNYIDYAKAVNFRESMRPLIPALLFLASATHDSRGLGYRPPDINLSGKMGVVGVSNNECVFEFRVFETCYQRPLAIIDFFIVISKALKFYKDTATDTSMKLGELGIKDGRGIDRFYYTVKHVEALERGLALLKPDYKTFNQLKKERGFSVDKDTLIKEEQKRHLEWREDFEEVKQRRRFEKLRLYNQGLAGAMELGVKDPEEYAKQYVEERVNEPERNLKGSVREYIKEQTAKFMTENVTRVITV